jgi:hypothetical protein
VGRRLPIIAGILNLTLCFVFPFRLLFYFLRIPLFLAVITGQSRLPLFSDQSGWFHRYNHRRIIEAGFKEEKGTFEIRHLKVRSEAGLFLQEKFPIFAANCVLWADQCVVEQCPQAPEGWRNSTQPVVKEQVKVGAQTSVWVSLHEHGCRVWFTDHSFFAGRSFKVKREWSYQMALPFAKCCCFSTM